MKKILGLLVAFVLLFSGCGGSDRPEIEEYHWVMDCVQSQDANGQIIAHGTGTDSAADSAQQMALTCQAEDGELTLSDQTNQKTYTGTYPLMETNSQSSLYQVTINDEEGMAVAAMTTYPDADPKPTWILSAGDYAIHFFGE